MEVHARCGLQQALYPVSWLTEGEFPVNFRRLNRCAAKRRKCILTYKTRTNANPLHIVNVSVKTQRFTNAGHSFYSHAHFRLHETAVALPQCSAATSITSRAIAQLKVAPLASPK